MQKVKLVRGKHLFVLVYFLSSIFIYGKLVSAIHMLHLLIYYIAYVQDKI